jgi:ribonuclease Y
MLEVIVTLIIAAPAGLAAGYFIRKVVAKSQGESVELKADKILNEAKNEAQTVLLSAKENALKVIEESKKEEVERFKQLKLSEDRAAKREEATDRKLQEVEARNNEVTARAQKVKEVKAELEQIRAQQLEKLEKVAALPRERAEAIVLDRVERDMNESIENRMKKMEKLGVDEMREKALNVLTLAMQRMSHDVASERTATIVELPSDDVKGRIIGKEGRNIKHIEKLTGIEIVVDDTPGAIIISGFNPVRRHVAKLAIEKLIADGRIHPSKIEECVESAKQEIALKMKEAGEAACYELGIVDFDPKLVQLLGRLIFRTSYGQNVLKHSLEMAHMAEIIAKEIGADVNIAKRGALLHDIGKAVDHEIEGTHTQIGANIGKKFNLDPRIIHCIESHHDDPKPETPEALITQTVDAISASRPGARRNSFEEYVQKLEELENLATSFEGVEKCYAIQAGREIRVFVTPDKIDDVRARQLAKDIAKKIEEQLKYPGEIKVNLLREMKIVEYAR